MDEADRAYLAGYFDGEGCASIQSLKIPAAVIRIVQQDRGPLDRIRADTGGTLVYRRNSNTWMLQIARSDDVERFVRAVYPFVRQKRAQLRIVYRLARLTGRPGARVSIFDRERRLALGAELNAENLRGRSSGIANRNARRIVA